MRGNFAPAVDASGAAYVCGATASANFPTTPGTLQTAYKGDTIYDPFGNGSGNIFGSDAYVTKPYSPRALLAKIREYMPK